MTPYCSGARFRNQCGRVNLTDPTVLRWQYARNERGAIQVKEELCLLLLHILTGISAFPSFSNWRP